MGREGPGSCFTTTGLLSVSHLQILNGVFTTQVRRMVAVEPEAHACQEYKRSIQDTKAKFSKQTSMPLCILTDCDIHKCVA